MPWIIDERIDNRFMSLINQLMPLVNKSMPSVNWFEFSIAEQCDWLPD